MRRTDDRRGNKGNFRGNNNSFGRFNNRPREPREMHKAVCAECKQECEVPFKPKEDRPVFCRECYMKKKDE